MLSMLCSCGKRIFGSEALVGQEIQCFQCRRMVVFGAPVEERPAAAPQARPGASAFSLCQDEEAEAPAPTGRSRRLRDALYWVLLLALLPLVTALFHEKDPSPIKRLERTVAAHPELKPLIEAVLNSHNPTLDKLFSVLPNQRIDDQAHLPRKTDRHLIYAGVAGLAFFVLVAGLMAHGFVPAWRLALAALFTATFGIACLLLFHGFLGHSYQETLQGESGLLINLVAFTAIVGLGEELCKALVVIFYLRTHKNATWRGACYWGMASGIGFGIAEGISYSANMYNGISPGDVYLTRYASCVALHAVWSASVGIALFNSRRLVNQVVDSLVYLGNLDRGQMILTLLQVLGVAMLLHGAYDALLTQGLFVPALLVALVSFAWLGWQIETAREQEAEELAYTRTRQEAAVAIA